MLLLSKQPHLSTPIVEYGYFSARAAADFAHKSFLLNARFSEIASRPKNLRFHPLFGLPKISFETRSPKSPSSDEFPENNDAK
jgi:hypothetical protein